MNYFTAMFFESFSSIVNCTKVSDLGKLKGLFEDPFKNAAQTLRLFKTWRKMEDAGFTLQQLSYLIYDTDDSLPSLAPTKNSILKISKTLYDGLNAIDKDHADITEANKDAATVELVRTKSAFIFDQSVVEKIVSLLEGTIIYNEEAPALKDLQIPPALSSKIKYTLPKDLTQMAAIQVTGILTQNEQEQAIALSNEDDWKVVFENAKKHPIF